MTSDRLREKGRFLSEHLAPARRTRIVDIGANPINHNPYDAFLEDDVLEVVGFEPQPEAFAKLEEAPKKNQTVFKAAVGDGSRQTLHLYKTDGFTSLLPVNPAFLNLFRQWRGGFREVGTLDVKTERLDEIEGLGPIDLLKIDIQGGETQVFQHGAATLRHAQVVLSEVAAIPLYEDQPLLDDQMRILRTHGYDLHKFLFFKQSPVKSSLSDALPRKVVRNQLIDGDAVFIRGFMALDDKPSEDLKHLAILAATVFDSADVVLRAMDVLVGRGEITGDVTEAFAGLYL